MDIIKVRKKASGKSLRIRDKSSTKGDTVGYFEDGDIIELEKMWKSTKEKDDQGNAIEWGILADGRGSIRMDFVEIFNDEIPIPTQQNVSDQDDANDDDLDE